MKRFMAIAAIVVVTIISGVTTASAADTRQFQSSPNDATTPTGISPYYDISNVQFGLTADDEFEIFVNMRSVPPVNAYTAPGAKATIQIDTDLDGVANYTIDSTGEYDPVNGKKRTLLDSKGQPVADCTAWGWLTGNAVAWRIDKSCFEYLNSTIGFKFSATQEGSVIDYFPEGSSWYKPKTGYMAVAPCSASNLNRKLTYKYVTYICMKSGSKWSWRDYGPVAAQNAKYATEKAYYACSLSGKIGAELGDGGKTLTVETYKKYDLSVYVSSSNFECVKKYVAMPSWVATMIGQTRALDGMVKASWGKINAFWNYHPDSGLGITFTTK